MKKGKSSPTPPPIKEDEMESSSNNESDKVKETDLVDRDFSSGTEPLDTEESGTENTTESDGDSEEDTRGDAGEPATADTETGDKVRFN